MSLFRRFGFIKHASIRMSFALLLVPSTALAEVSVLTSIKPLALIAQEITGDKSEVDVLLPINASPHDYPLRVSDIRRMQKADLILWVGPSLETFLTRPLNNIPANKRLAVYELAGMHWPDEDLHQHVTDDGHEHHGHDPHVWLDPRNAIVIAQALAKKLGAIDPDSAAHYEANAKKFSAEMAQLDAQLMALLEPVREKGFAVYHEGYLHFVEHYGLQQLDYVTFTPERRPGAKHLYDLRKRLKGRAECLFIEPYYNMDNATDLAHELNLKVATLDPIGEEQVTSYRQLLEQMARTFLACLANRPTTREM